MSDARPTSLHHHACVVKDLNATAGLLTTSGSPLHKDDIPAADEFMVGQVRSAGANLFCKTNTPFTMELMRASLLVLTVAVVLAMASPLACFAAVTPPTGVATSEWLQ